MFDIQAVRKDFPSLEMEVYGKPLVFLDSAASSLKPKPVIDAISNYYETINSNVHRGAHRLSILASEAFEKVRVQIKEYIHADESGEVIFTKGTTEAINLLAHGFADFIKEGDEILITEMEHHANIIPWQRLCEKNKALLKVIPIHSSGELKLDKFKQLLSENTKVLALTHVSNVLGTVNPLKEMIELAHRNETVVVVDGAQGIVHGEVNVSELGCDFYCFSGHKFYGPMGIGVLYGKKNWLEKLPPYQLGGAMINQVSFEKTSYKGIPQKFEAGTPNVSGVIGLGAAIDYIEKMAWSAIEPHEQALLKYAEEKLQQIDGLHIVGTVKTKAPICSFDVEGIHAYDIGTLLDRYGVACRAGNHCTQPLHDTLGIAGTIRASFAFYNTMEEVDLFVDALNKSLNMLR